MRRTAVTMASLLALAGCLPAPLDAVQNRCLQYGFTGQNALAHCTETEMNAPPAAPISFGRINAAQDRCMALGYTGNALAECTQRHARALAP